MIEHTTKGNKDAIAVLGPQVRENTDTIQEITREGVMAKKMLMEQGGRIDHVEKEDDALKREHDIVQKFMKQIQEKMKNGL